MKKLFIFLLAAAALQTLPAQEGTPRRLAEPQSESVQAAQRTDAEPSDAISAQRHFRVLPRANAPAPRRATAEELGEVPILYGTVTSASYGSTCYNTYGVYEVPTIEGTDFELIKGDIDAKFSAVALGTTLYVPTEEEIPFGVFYSVDRYDIADEFNFLGSNSCNNDHFKARCMAPDPTQEGVAYGCFYNGNAGYNFSRVDYVNRTETVIKAISTQWQVCAVDAGGDVYAIDSSKRLYSVDKTNGEMTLLTTLEGVNVNTKNAGCFDPKSGLLYFTSNSSYTGAKAGLYALNVETFETILVCEFQGGEQLTSLFIPNSGIAENAPGAPTNLAASFPEGALTGTVSFDMPATYFDGTEATGAFHYTIAVDGVEVANGIEGAAAHVDREITVAEAGRYKIVVNCFNNNGSGPKVKTQLYIGKDAPLAVTNVVASYADGIMTVTWDPASGSVNGGYVDPEQVVYTVKRLPDGAIVALNIPSTEFSAEYAAPENELVSYSFEVTAAYEGLESEPALSNSVVLGHVVPPVSWVFDSTDAMAGFSIIDANADGKTWTLNTYNQEFSIAYNSREPMDDWLILPPVKLLGGYSYTITYEDKCSSARYSEHLEILLGSTSVPAEMTQTIAERYEITETSYTTRTAKITVEADGIYHIGFHGCSDKDRNRLYLRNISISAPAAPVAPQAVTEFTATPDPQGYNTVDISFTAPALKVDGTELDKCNITLLRNDEEVTVFENVAASTPVSFQDTVERGGTYTYTAIPSCGSSEGESSTLSVFVGLKTPQAVADVLVVENEGIITVSWTAPTLDIENNPINAELVRYNVYFLDGIGDAVIIGEEISGTTIDHQPQLAEGQSLALYVVEAVTDGGVGARVASDAIAIGEAYTLPYFDSFGQDKDYIYGTRSISGTSNWMTLNDVVVDIISSVDGDNAFLAVQQTGNAVGEFFTGKISLADTTEPVFSFYVFNTLDDDGLYPDHNTVEVVVRADNRWTVARTIDISETGAPNQWNKVFVPLSAYAGKTVQLALRVSCNTFLLTAFDALAVNASERTLNLTLGAIEAPGEVYAGEETFFKLPVANTGMTAASSFRVDFEVDGEIVDTRTPIGEIAPGHNAALVFRHTFDEADGATHLIKAILTMSGDEDESDNTAETSLTVEPSYFPAATGLRVSADADKVSLVWDAPDMTTVRPDATIEDFEGYEAFERNPAGWTLVDRDGAAIGGLNGIVLPGITYGAPYSFWVAEASEAVFGNYAATFLGHNSLKYLMQLYAIDADGNPTACDDWAISPELFGCKQTVSLWARSYSRSYPESFRILYSTGSTNPDDFVELASYTAIPDIWTCYSVQLPEGAKRLAINCVTADGFSFMADDVQFIPAAGTTSLAVESYDVFCNGEYLGNALSESFSTAIPEVDGDYSYTVAVRYNKGVGPMSEAATLQYSSVEGISANAVRVAARRGAITVSGAQGLPVSIVNTVGMRISATANAPASLTVPVGSGFYVVTAGGGSYKVFVP